MKKLTPQALKLIRSNGMLYGKISDLIGVSPVSLKDMLNANEDERLIGTGVLALIKNHLVGMQDMQLVEEMQVLS